MPTDEMRTWVNAWSRMLIEGAREADAQEGNESTTRAYLVAPTDRAQALADATRALLGELAPGYVYAVFVRALTDGEVAQLARRSVAAALGAAHDRRVVVIERAPVMGAPRA